MAEDGSGYDFSRLRVLVCDDSVYIRKLVTAFLEAFEVGEVLQAETVDGGFRVFTDEEPDLVIADWNMAPESGLDLLHLIRWNPASPNRFVPFIMLTGYTELYRVKTARDAGVTTYLAKPIDARSLYTRLVGVVDDERLFVSDNTYFGPDRRTHKRMRYNGVERRGAL